MIAVLFAATLLGKVQASSEAAQKYLLDCFGAYQKLSSFSMSIRHEVFWGDFPGVYSQSLHWSKDRFDLRVTRKVKLSDMDKEHPFKRAPNYRAQGSKVLCLWPDKHATFEDLHPASGVVPSWEATGGPIMSFLQETSVASSLEVDPVKSGFTFAFGPLNRWQGHHAKEVVVHFPSERGGGYVYDFFFDVATKHLLGYQLQLGSKIGTVSYTRQIENPDSGRPTN